MKILFALLLLLGVSCAVHTGGAGPDPFANTNDPAADDDDSGVGSDDVATDDDDSAVGGDNAAAGDDDAAAYVPCSTWLPALAKARVLDSALVEISGIAASRQHQSLLWVIEDSGAAALVTAINPKGESVGQLRLSGIVNTDWEDLALGPCGKGLGGDCLWIGEFGDNNAARSQVSLLRVPEPSPAELSPRATLERTATIFPFTYPEGPQDVEALVVDPRGGAAVLTKRSDGTSRIYDLSHLSAGTLGEARLLAQINTGPAGLGSMTTAADLNYSGDRLLVRTYTTLRELELPAAGLIGAAEAVVHMLSPAAELQGEAVAYDVLEEVVWHISEGANPLLYYLPCED